MKKNKDAVITLRVSQDEYDSYKKIAKEANLPLSKLILLRLARDNVVISPDLAGVVKELYLIRREAESGKFDNNICERIDKLCLCCESLKGKFKTYRC